MSNNLFQQDGFISSLAAKFLPAALGAAVMIAVDIPKTKRELFIRLMVAFACSYLFGEAVFDFLDSFSMFSFLDHAKRAHHTAIDGLVGAMGYSAASGLAIWMKRFRAAPVDAVKDLRP